MRCCQLERALALLLLDTAGASCRWEIWQRLSCKDLVEVTDANFVVGWKDLAHRPRPRFACLVVGCYGCGCIGSISSASHEGEWELGVFADKNTPQTSVNSVSEEIVRNDAEAVLVEIGDCPLLGFFRDFGFLARDEESRVFARGEVENKLAAGVLSCGERFHDVHLLDIEGRGSAARLANGGVGWDRHDERPAY